jgi:3-deoxy-manno-octulosonate cytidylyltransferase (CMP-KDO synthetase)
MRIAVVIPARLASTRLPEKLLLRETGQSVLSHTYHRARQARCAGEVIVAVDDPRMAAEVHGFGGTVVMTDPRAPSGTDRIAQVAQARPDLDILVNVQGDEPEIEPAAIDRAAALLLAQPDASIATLASPIRQVDRLHDPSCVKVVVGEQHRAIYFSRAAIPHPRDGMGSLLEQEPPLYWHHIGLYAYRREFLLRFSSLPPGRLESVEKLEQLRALEHGFQIVVDRWDHAARGIDTRADYEAFVERFRANS